MYKLNFNRTVLYTLYAFVMVWSLPATATNVVIETPLGSFEVELFDEAAPVTVANFLKYVEDGDYENSFIHRNDPGFVIQGGGYRYDNGEVAAVPADDPILNEYNQSNVRGTIAMARVQGSTNSATSQWFINISDDNVFLDEVDGGFTVFGKVINDGMQVVDAINNLDTWVFNPPFNELPLVNYSPDDGETSPSFDEFVITTFSIADQDGDAINDIEDNCPSISNPDQANNDGDSLGDSCDEDDDNDGLSDEEEISLGSNPLVNEVALLLLLFSSD